MNGTPTYPTTYASTTPIIPEIDIFVKPCRPRGLLVQLLVWVVLPYYRQESQQSRDRHWIDISTGLLSTGLPVGLTGGHGEVVGIINHFQNG